MFNVSALLLDDALKSATPLTNGAINETLTFHAGSVIERVNKMSRYVAKIIIGAH